MNREVTKATPLTQPYNYFYAPAIVDPDDLRNFAANLERNNQLVADATEALKSQFSSLGETWRDQEQVKFGQDFEQTVCTIVQFQQASQEHILFLCRKASEIDQYLNQ
jgi:uncharacterized protein YukE